MAASRPTQDAEKQRQNNGRVGALDGSALSEALIYGAGDTRQMAKRSGPEQFLLPATISQLILEHEGELVQNLLERIPFMVTMLDSAANALYVNKEAERVLGWTQQEISEHPDIYAACYPDPAEREEVREFARRGESRWREFRMTNKHAVRVPCMWMTIRVGAVLFGVGIDISEQVQREADAQKTREDVEARVQRRIPPADPYGLTFRELTVLTLVAEGKTDREIAELLSIGCRTVQTHISNILTKMGAKVRTEAGVRAVREGVIE
jgi:PAS domain S-box-containing protein